MPARIYPHDRLLERTVLKAIPDAVTPNQITIFRILVTPAVLWLLWREDYSTGIVLFLLIAFTDMVDGSLARTRDRVTPWGMLWDPIADKLLIGSVVALLLFRNFPPGLIAIVFGLEAAFLAGGYWRKRQGHVVAANWFGKIKMLLQVFAVTLYLLYLALGDPLFATLSYGVILLAAGFALASLFKHGL